MAIQRLPRRSLLGGLAALAAMPSMASAREVIELTWNDLLPEDPSSVPPLPQRLLSLLSHDEASLASQQPRSTGVRSDWNGKTVRIPGFVVPLAFAGAGVTSFILVPYVGACIHVPPPPANQLVLVTAERPYEVEGLFAAVSVTGTFATAATSTELAQIGYALSADRIEPYG
ncbi:MAG: DUF3299 domain-containing protein [Pseudomonadota bacterium]